MKNQYSEAKLIFISNEQKQMLIEIRDDVKEIGGETSLNQIIRDAIDILLKYYKNDIVKKYTPIKLEDLVQRK